MVIFSSSEKTLLKSLKHLLVSSASNSLILMAPTWMTSKISVLLGWRSSLR